MMIQNRVVLLSESLDVSVCVCFCNDVFLT